MVEKAGLGKHRRSREVIIKSSSLMSDDGSCEGKVVDGVVHVLDDGHVQGSEGGTGLNHWRFPRRKS